MFWAGGGLNQCRDELTKQLGSEASSSSIVPATPEALLRLILTLEEPEIQPVLITKVKKGKKFSDDEEIPDRGQSFPWRTVALTSAVWLTALGVLGVSLTSQIQRQDKRLQQLIERIEFKDKQPLGNRSQ